MKERHFQTRFLHWLKNNFSSNAAFELKICHEDSIPFSALREHQRDSLLAVKRRSLAYKIPDDSRGFKPFDCFALHCEAFVVVQFYKPRTKHFYIIDIEAWVAEDAKPKPRSLTEARAAEIGRKAELGVLE